ncbi:GGDEF domain-containing protein [Reinekea marinisedimentorum]|uniref:diguanylate cyclase n=1 Tax=Reinekea marinisedimentorum TaxID=230495 RepID=A0A4V2UJF5_9GAMM|nr:GGDEF domain-containing protein [Reinekea marinisedimentorum]TCS39990.1 diguanylate cyclase (GGDEF)-like protein [Reinekea marinisedimentorum]
MANSFTQISFGTNKALPQTLVDATPVSVESLTPEKVVDFRLQLSSQLQTTLEIEQLITILYRQLKKIMPVSGIEYMCEKPHAKAIAGRLHKHRCCYQLSMDKMNFGEIIFTRNKRFSEKELATIESMMDLVIFPIRNALKHLEALACAMIDPLTGLYNRTAMSISLTREIERARRHEDQSISILAVDIDHFKSINDRYGHLTGDNVLRQVAQIVQSSIRGCDASFRWGGEEFLICLSNSNASLAHMVAERIREAIADSTLLPDKERQVTASFGIANYSNESDWPALVDRADKALYSAKAQGRNRTVTSLSPQVNSQFA